jgi:tyrosine-protein kinase Etk/Wzc
MTMSEDKSIDFLDMVVLLVKAKKFFLTLGICVLLASYGLIYFFVPSQYEASALIIPSEPDQLNALSSLMKNFSSLPIGLSSNRKATTADMYKTLIYSRTNLEQVIKKFGIYDEYKLKSQEAALALVSKTIATGETDEKAFFVKVRASSPQKAADMTNFIVGLLNQNVIEMNVRKSKFNREFLETRIAEIRTKLEKAEDSLKDFQDEHRFLDVESQMRILLETYAKSESDVAAKETEMSIAEKLYGLNSAQYKQAKIVFDNLKSSEQKLKSGQDKSSIYIPFNSLSTEVLSYYRLYRDVQMAQAMLESVLPLYEQAKFDEQKDIPILQVIDRATPPEKRIAPKRTTLSLGITFCVLLFAFVVMLLSNVLKRSTEPRLLYIRKNLFTFRKATSD